MLDASPSTDFGEILFAAGLPGFPGSGRFQLAPWGRLDGEFRIMTSLDDPEACFVLASPWLFYPDYEFELDEATAARLGVVDRDDAAVWCLVTLADRPEDATINLLGPIVVNRRTGEAAQVALPAGHDVRAPLGPPGAAR